MMMISTLLTTILITATTNSMVQSSEVPCQFASKEFTPCLPYLTHKQNKPTPTCCQGVKSIRDMLIKQLAAEPETKPDMNRLCDCLRGVGKSSEIDYVRGDGLPSIGNCGILLPFPLEPQNHCFG